jgi:hypothetical protein
MLTSLTCIEIGAKISSSRTRFSLLFLIAYIQVTEINIHVLLAATGVKTWMPGPSPGMADFAIAAVWIGRSIAGDGNRSQANFATD